MRTTLVAAITSAALPLLAVTGAPAPATAGPGTAGRAAPAELPATIYGGAWPTSHVQGVAVDRTRGFVYYSFTQMLVKTDLAGTVLGTVTGLTGHLGDLDLNPEDGRLYGSLEYKAEKAFYIAIFDVDRLDRIGMDAETDGVMTTVHLKEVVDDFVADLDGNGVFDGDTADTADHRYGCSGIDGVSFGPQLGKRHGRNVLMVAYGIYANVDRADNDYQVLLEYDVRNWGRYERPLRQQQPHRSGPQRVDDKIFVRTGNTRYGVQNLEYDAHTGNWMMAVYKGTKPQFPNYSLYLVDGSAKPRRAQILGQPRRETGNVVPLAPAGLRDPETGVRGYESLGDYGLESLGRGRFYIATGKAVTVDGVTRQDATLTLNHWTGQTPTPFAPVS
ncbi:hypothetical protein [Plantactinospora sp. CA-290183]|uniref:hypothetical protein n=1 Tax=Plantactinospora sp. CA-290183 TaxID=3240006 RepID=UPI003D8C1DEB